MKRDPRPRCGGPGGKVILTKEEAQAELKRFRSIDRNRGHVYQCSWSGADWHYHHTKQGRRRGSKGK